ncbi:MAG TPA: hypothetical protein PKV98_04135 [Burkholderiaceae bacterium]|nr:hypothetical protein [Burkholderiaceae bacterium]
MNNDVITLENLGLSANEVLMMKQAGDLLERHYPGHGWLVGINQGMMDIKPMSVDTGQMVYSICHVASHSSSDLDKKILDAGGAWLEVLRQRRGAIDHDALSALKTDAAGRVRPEL